jgi:hypothetical protein
MNATRVVIPNKPPINAWTCGECKRIHTSQAATPNGPETARLFFTTSMAALWNF